MGFSMAFHLRQETLGFTPKVDFNAGVVAAGEAQIESTVTGNAPKTFIPDAQVALRLGAVEGVGSPDWSAGPGDAEKTQNHGAPQKIIQVMEELGLFQHPFLSDFWIHCDLMKPQIPTRIHGMIVSWETGDD